MLRASDEDERTSVGRRLEPEDYEVGVVRDLLGLAAAQPRQPDSPGRSKIWPSEQHLPFSGFCSPRRCLWVSGAPSATKELDATLSVRRVIGLLLLEVEGALELSTVYCFTILLFRGILRREWAVMMAAILLAGVPHLFDSTADSLGTIGSWGFVISSTLGAAW